MGAGRVPLFWNRSINDKRRAAYCWTVLRFYLAMYREPLAPQWIPTAASVSLSATKESPCNTGVLRNLQVFFSSKQTTII